MQNDAHGVNDKLRYQRQMRGWSQKKLADVLDTSKELIGRWERGVQQPSPYYQEKLCVLFKKSAEELGFLVTKNTVSQLMLSESQIPPFSETTPVAQNSVQPFALCVFDGTTNDQKGALENTTFQNNEFFRHDSHNVSALFEEGMRAIALASRKAQWSVEELQGKIYQGIINNYPSKQNDQIISRRDILLALTGLPCALLELERTEKRSSLYAEEVISLCLTTIPACWSLVYEGGIQHVETVLPTYLTYLSMIIQSSPRHQRIAARLASQGYKLANLLALQREDYSLALRYSEDAFTYGKLSGDTNLQVAALIEKALTFWYRRRPSQTLQTYQEALQEIHSVSPIIKGRVYAGLAEACARLGRKQEALRYIGLAQNTFPDDPEADESFFYTHYNQYYLHLYCGLTYANLNQTSEALKAYSHFHQRKYESRRAEVANREAEVFLALGDLGRCYESINMAVPLASALHSDLRYSEAYEIWQDMKTIWPHESKVEELSELFQKGV